MEALGAALVALMNASRIRKWPHGVAISSYRITAFGYGRGSPSYQWPVPVKGAEPFALSLLCLWTYLLVENARPAEIRIPRSILSIQPARLVVDAKSPEIRRLQPDYSSSYRGLDSVKLTCDKCMASQAINRPRPAIKGFRSPLSPYLVTRLGNHRAASSLFTLSTQET